MNEFNAPPVGAKESEKTEEEEDRLSGNFDSEKYAHYVKRESLKNLGTGKPVVALCGKIWVPKKVADNYPICQECQKVFKSLFGQEN